MNFSVNNYFRKVAESFNAEVLFRCHHLTHLPWREYEDWDHIPLLGGISEVPLQQVPIQVRKLCHVTHEQAADKIIHKDHDQDYYIFKPNKKCGKVQGIGATYTICEPTDQPPSVETTYRYLSSNESVFPGYYIWWSIDHDNYPPSSSEYYFSHFFSPSSRYGNSKFSGNIKELLQCYQEAYIKDKVDPLTRIQFRCGGTLRYRREICKVVIVCTDEHPLPEDEFPRMWQGHGFRYNKDGKITFVEPIEVMIRNGVSGVRGPYKPYSWDTYAFAFYFPDDTYMLVCPTSEKFRFSEIEHDDLCLASRPNPHGSGYICPNKLPSPYKSMSSTSCLDFSPLPHESAPLFQIPLSPSHPQLSSSSVLSNLFSSPVSNNKSNKEVSTPPKKQRLMFHHDDDDDDDDGW